MAHQKQTWTKGDVITAAKLNHMEEGIEASSGVWSGKTFVAFGTSITYLCSNYNGGYLEKIKEICGFSDYGNAGVSGAPMVNNTKNGNGINYKIKNTAISRDLVLIECCTNDFKLNVPVGMPDTTNVDTYTVDGLTMNSCTVTMGGTALTNVYTESSGYIQVPNVSGDVVITATTE